MKHYSGIDYEHFLDDIRDMYPFSIDEAVLVELIANSLDAKTSLLDIRIDPAQNLLELTDNGKGMDAKGFEMYHNFSTSFKRKGQGIGFAGLGAKLALKITDRVVTETRQQDSGRGSSKTYWGASEWRFERKGKHRYPVWYDVDDRTIPHHGTRVRMFLKQKAHLLLRPDEVKQVILEHYLPLLTLYDFYESLRLHHRITILVNGEILEPPKLSPQQFKETILHRGHSRKPFAHARFELHESPLPEPLQGIAVTTFGKIIKRDFLKQYFNGMERVTGMIEVPELVECLTTNKCDFRKEGNAGRKYYRFGKIAQHEFRRWLEVMQIVERKEHTVDKDVQRLQRMVNHIVGEIPDLQQFYGLRAEREALVKDELGEYSGAVPEPAPRGEDSTDSGAARLIQEALERAERGGQTLEAGETASAVKRVRSTKFGPVISYTESPDRTDISWMEGDTVLINTAHPAYRKASEKKVVEYHNFVAIALAMLREIPTSAEKLDLLEEFMNGWGKM